MSAIPEYGSKELARELVEKHRAIHEAFWKQAQMKVGDRVIVKGIAYIVESVVQDSVTLVPVVAKENES